MFPLLIFLSASAPLEIKAPCPDVKPVQDFNLTGFASGTWYEIARYPDDIEKQADCVIAEFNNDKERNKFKLSDVTDHHYIFFEGYIELAKDAGNSGAVVLRSSIFTATEGEPTFPVYFLDIDYKSYYIAYKCKYDAATNTRKDFAWVASRTKTLEPAAKAKIDDFLKTDDQNAHPIDVKQLIWIHFTDDACKVI